MDEILKTNSVMIKVLQILLKIIVFIFLLVLFFVIGLFIGYVVVGDGNFWEVLNRDTWQHIFDFIK